MPGTGRGLAGLGALVGLSALTMGVGLGGAGRLTYHEAIVGQAAREMLDTGRVLIPTIGGRPWLEKPPLAVWLVAALGRLAGGVDESVARAPSAVAAGLLVLGVASVANRRFGPDAGLLAGLIQATTAWTVSRGRLAEADVALACVVTWAVVAFDRLRTGVGPVGWSAEAGSTGPAGWRRAFFGLLGLSALSKGVGFGGAMVLSVVALTLLWDRDRGAARRLLWWRGWALSAAIGLTWPVLAALRHPSALGLWALHVSDRLADKPRHFTGRSWWAIAPELLGMLLPWTPLVVVGAARALPGAVRASGRGGGDRLLLAWAVGPVALLSLATAKNAHYAIYALPPCSVWASRSLLRLGERLRAARGWPAARVRRAAWAGFAGLGLAYAVGFAALGPAFDRRGVEWAFYREAARSLRPGEPVALLYHVPDWDREPYATPFGPFPHDWPVRLFYLGRPAACRFGFDDLANAPLGPPSAPFAVVGRESDLDGLRAFGRVETLAQGPPVRFDRTYRLYRVTPETPPLADRTAGDARRR